MAIVTGAVSPEGHHKLKHFRTQKTPCGVGRVNGVAVLALRDTGSTTCVVKIELVRPEQMTGSYELCMLIDGVVKQFPTVIVQTDTPFYKGHAKALCMDHPVHELIIGNIPGVHGLRQHRAERTEVMVRCDAIDKLINGSQNNVTTVVDTKEVCDSTQGQCETLEKSLNRSSSDTSTEIKRNDVVERPQIQNDEHELSLIHI